MTTAITPGEFKTAMEDIAKEADRKKRHIAADLLLALVLQSLGYEDGALLYAGMDRWYA